MIRLIRLKTVANVIHFWDFIAKSFNELATKHSEVVDLDAIQKTMHWLVRDHERAWFVVVLEDDEPVAFSVICDSTPPFETKRTWMVRWFYHTPGHFSATLFMKKDFESFAKSANISSYLVTTSRQSGGAIRCFQSERYGFKKAFLTFERTL